MHPIIETNRTELKQLGDRYGALSVSAFGSMARGDASADSDSYRTWPCSLWV
jgi:predicted nucleotidyltransferase